jgi:hypothetical protein
MTLLIAVLTAGVCSVLLSGCRQKTEAAKPPAPTQAKAPSQVAAAPQATATAGSKAPISLVAYYPLTKDHQFIIDYLKQIQKKHPKEISLTVYDTQTPEGRRKWMTTGLSCAGVFVNGKTHWEIKRGGKTETADFIKRLDSFWTREDFEAVIKQLLEQAKKQAK